MLKRWHGKEKRQARGRMLARQWVAGIRASNLGTAPAQELREMWMRRMALGSNVWRDSLGYSDRVSLLEWAGGMSSNRSRDRG
jgi:hypothetical protein